MGTKLFQEIADVTGVQLTLYGITENEEKGVTVLVQLLAVTQTTPVGSTP
jgi:hypothetical protein